jgi:hypothetical protein
MSLYFLQKALHQLTSDDQAAAAFSQSPDSIVSKFDLTNEEAEALKQKDLLKLYNMGVHCLLITQVALTFKLQLPWFGNR